MMKVGFYTSQREYEEKMVEFNEAMINSMKNGVQTLVKMLKFLKKKFKTLQR